jgi:hypothetical protein
VITDQIGPTMSDYGTATVIRREDGTLVVAHADKTIAVHRGVLEQMLPGHLHDDGTIQLDCAGRYRYRATGEIDTHHQIVFYELLPNASEHFSHHPQSHITEDVTQ